MHFFYYIDALIRFFRSKCKTKLPLNINDKKRQVVNQHGLLT